MFIKSQEYLNEYFTISINIDRDRVNILYNREIVKANNAYIDKRRKGREKAVKYNGRVLLPSRPIRLETISDIHLPRGSTPRNRTEPNGPRPRLGTRGIRLRGHNERSRKVSASRGREISG